MSVVLELNCGNNYKEKNMFDFISFLRDALLSLGHNNPVIFWVSAFVCLFVVGPRVLKSLTTPRGKPWRDVLDLNKRINQPSVIGDALAYLLAAPFKLLIFSFFAVLVWFNKKSAK